MEEQRPEGKSGRCGGRIGDGPERHLYSRAAPAPQHLVNVRLQHLATRIHALGPRALAEMLAEHVAKGGDLFARCERYATISPAALAATGGDRFVRRLASIDGARR